MPTGVIADRYGRRKAFILSCVVRGLALVGLGFGVTIYEVAFLIFLTAIGETMLSGASESWLISNLQKGTRVRDVYRALALIGGAAGLIFGTIGAALFTYSSSLIWFSSGAVLGVAGLVAFFAPEGSVEDPKDKPSSLRSIIQDVLTLSGRLWREVPLFHVIILQAAAGAGAGLYWQLVVIERSVSWAPSAV